jgi:hypothetical protein
VSTPKKKDDPCFGLKNSTCVQNKVANSKRRTPLDPNKTLTIVSDPSSSSNINWNEVGKAQHEVVVDINRPKNILKGSITNGATSNNLEDNSLTTEESFNGIIDPDFEFSSKSNELSLNRNNQSLDDYETSLYLGIDIKSKVDLSKDPKANLTGSQNHDLEVANSTQSSEVTSEANLGHKNDPKTGATGTQGQYKDPEVTKVTTETDPKLTIQANVETNLENDHKNDPEVGATGTQSQYNDPEVTKITTETDSKLTIQANVETNLENDHKNDPEVGATGTRPGSNKSNYRD